MLTLRVWFKVWFGNVLQESKIQFIKGELLLDLHKKGWAGPKNAGCTIGDTGLTAVYVDAQGTSPHCSECGVHLIRSLKGA